MKITYKYKIVIFHDHDIYTLAVNVFQTLKHNAMLYHLFIFLQGQVWRVLAQKTEHEIC